MMNFMTFSKRPLGNKFTQSVAGAQTGDAEAQYEVIEGLFVLVCRIHLVLKLDSLLFHFSSRISRKWLPVQEALVQKLLALSTNSRMSLLPSEQHRKLQ